MPPEAKKIKDEPKDEKTDKEELEYEKQCKTLFKIRDKLKTDLKKKDCVELLEENNQYVPSGIDEILDHLADVITFGALSRCKSCEGGQFIFTNNQYECKGNVSEWSKCSETTKTPKRVKFEVPDSFEGTSVFSKYKPKVQIRKIKELARTYKVKKEDEVDGPRVAREKPPLYLMKFVIDKTSKKMSVADLQKKIIQLGGKIEKKIDETTMAVVSVKESVERLSSRCRKAKEANIHVIDETFLEIIKKGKDYSEAIKAASICDWGSEPATRLGDDGKSMYNKTKSMYQKKSSGPVKLQLKGGDAVDPDSELQDVAHVYQDSAGVKYSAVLAKTDIARNKNSFYKIQLLKADRGNR